jgi:hypothetical protein
MTTTLNASTAGAGGFIATSDNSGILALQTAGTTAVTIDTSQRVAFVAGTAALPAITTTGDTNTGIWFPAADTIAFTEGGTESLRIDSSANLQFNSGYGSVATAYGCRAWVNFNGTGTVAIRGSGNVTSITDNGTGNYTINFTTAMPDVNYSVSGYCTNPSSRALVFGDVNTYATGSLRINSAYISGTNGEATSVDATYVNISIFR